MATNSEQILELMVGASQTPNSDSLQAKAAVTLDKLLTIKINQEL